jgi:hypothetical protein
MHFTPTTDMTVSIIEPDASSAMWILVQPIQNSTNQTSNFAFCLKCSTSTNHIWPQVM